MIESLYQKYLKFPKIITDSRKVQENSLFFALKGENFNGNLFAEEALKKGCRFAIIDEEEFALDERFILVDDVLKTLQDLALHHRKKFDIPFIAIGGSNGKTTTKELVYQVLSTKYKTFATPGNFNNHIGVPLSLLMISSEIEMAIIEIGANHEGEIAELCEIARPTQGIITNIGLDHLEGFGSLEGVARANSELYYFLLQNGGEVFVNTQEEHLSRMASRFKKIITYPEKDDYFHAELLPSHLFVRYKTEKKEVITTKLFGEYNFANIATALCIGKYFNIPSTKANEAVAVYQAQNNRSQIIEKESNVILLDAYNANPSSMQKAIENFVKIEAEQKMVILGDMFELGEESTKEHTKIGELLADLKIDIIVLFGEEMKEALKHLPEAFYFTDKFSLHNWLQDKAIENTHILIKGSRGVKLETTLDFLTS